MKLKKQVPAFIHQGRRESAFQMKVIQTTITYLEKKMEHLINTVLGDELIYVIMDLNRKHYEQLNALAGGRGFNEGILNWLGYVIKTEADEEENSNNNNDEEMFEEVIEEIEMDEEEIREMEEQRFIDESSDDDVEYDSDGPRFDPFVGKSQGPINLDNVKLIDEDAEGFKLVTKKRNSLKQKIKQEIKKTKTMTVEQAKEIADINTLLPENRWNLYRLWIKLFVKNFETRMKAYRDEYRKECLRFNGLRNQEDIEIVKKAKIIGMTTTGAAKYRHIIDGTKPRITSKLAFSMECHNFLEKKGFFKISCNFWEY